MTGDRVRVKKDKKKRATDYKKRNRFKLNWLAKLIILYIVVLGIVFLVQVLYTVPYIKNSKVVAAESYQEEIAKNISRTLNNTIIMTREELEKNAALPEFVNMDIEAQTDILIAHIYTTVHLMNIYTLDSEGWFVSSSLEDLSPFQTKSYEESPFFTVPFIDGEIFYNEPSYYKSVGDISFSIGIPIESDTGERVGVLYGSMRLNDLIQWISDYELKEGTEIVLVTDEGIVVAHSNIDLFSLEDGPLSLDYNDRLDVQTIIEGKNATFEDEHDGRTYFNSTSIIQSNKWGVVVETEQNVLLAETNKIVRLLWLINGLLLIIPIGILIIFSHQIDKDRARSEKMLKTSNTELQQFAYVASHDLQEPLRVITSYVQLLAKRYKDKLDPDANDFIGFIEDRTIRMQDMINDLLAFSRISTRGKPLKPSSLEEALGNALSNLEVSIEESGADIKAYDLPTVNGDPSQLIRLFQNLIGNAIKFKGEKPLKISIKSTWKKNKWVISISDNGIGIDTQYTKRIFDIFQTLHPKDKYPGTGIGLAITKRIIERHGGNIWVESEIGKGSVFYFTLPKVKGQ